MKLLITGSAGMLGTSIVPTLVAAGNEVVATDIDLTNPDAVGGRRARRSTGSTSVTGPRCKAAFDTVAPDFVLHLAAETSLEASDDDPDHAYLTNTIATSYIALRVPRPRRADDLHQHRRRVRRHEGERALHRVRRPEPDQHLRGDEVRGREARGRHPREVLHHPGRLDGRVAGADKDHKFVARILSQVREGRTTIHAVGDKFGTPDLHLRLRPLLARPHALGGLRPLPHGLRAATAAATTWPPASSRCSAATTSSSSRSTRSSSPRSSRPTDPAPRSCGTWPSTCRA